MDFVVSDQYQGLDIQGNNNQRIKNYQHDIYLICQKSCTHYKRECLIFTNCCKRWYRCRICHDESLSCEQEIVRPENVTKVKCLNCKLEQSPNNMCLSCKQIFGKNYYCQECKLYENDTSKNIFHCEQCQICVIGKKEEKYHCQKCNICISLRKKSTHKCTENSLDQNCPICLVNMKYSGKPCINFKQCSHWLHEQCWNEYKLSSQNNKCVVCSKAIVKQNQSSIEAIDKIVEQGEKAIKKLHFQTTEKKIDIYCKQCDQKTLQVQYNVLAQKCGSCGCYNTVVL